MNAVKLQMNTYTYAFFACEITHKNSQMLLLFFIKGVTDSTFLVLTVNIVKYVWFLNFPYLHFYPYNQNFNDPGIQMILKFPTTEPFSYLFIQ